MDNQFNNGNDPWNQYGNGQGSPQDFSNFGPGSDAQYGPGYTQSGPNYSEGNGSPQFGPGYNNGNYGQNFGDQNLYGNMDYQYSHGSKNHLKWRLAIIIPMVAGLAIAVVLTFFILRGGKKVASDSSESSGTEQVSDSAKKNPDNKLVEKTESSASSGESNTAQANADTSTDSNSSDASSTDGSTVPDTSQDSSTSLSPSDIDWSYVTDDMKYQSTGIGTDMSVSDFKASCTEMDYDDALAHPEKYIGKNLYFYGEVITDLKSAEGLNTQYYEVMPFDYKKAQELYQKYNNLNSFDWDWGTSVFCTYDFHKIVFAFDTQDQSQDTYLSGFKSKTVQFYGTFGGLCATTDSATRKTIYRIGFDIKYAQLTPEQDTE